MVANRGGMWDGNERSYGAVFAILFLPFSQFGILEMNK